MFPYPLQWGPPTFSAGHSFAMMSAVIVSMVEVSISFLVVSYFVPFPDNCYLGLLLEHYYIHLYIASITSLSQYSHLETCLSCCNVFYRNHG